DQDVVAGGHEAPEEEHGDEHAELRPAGLLGGHGSCRLRSGGWGEFKGRQPDSPSGHRQPHVPSPQCASPRTAAPGTATQRLYGVVTTMSNVSRASAAARRNSLN